jgi:uncharacterized protein with GYD domain
MPLQEAHQCAGHFALDWTEQGIRNVKDSPGRLDAAKQLCKKHGAEITAFFITMGGHDMVVMLQAPGDAAIARIALVLGGGNVRTEMLNAFSEAEYRQVVRTLG